MHKPGDGNRERTFKRANPPEKNIFEEGKGICPHLPQPPPKWGKGEKIKCFVSKSHSIYLQNRDKNSTNFLKYPNNRK